MGGLTAVPLLWGVYTGFSNSIGGDLTVTSGGDAQNLEIAANATLTVAGDASFDVGEGHDILVG